MHPQNEDLFQRFVEQRGLSDHTIKVYWNVLQQLDTFVQGDSFKDLDENVMRRFWRDIKPQWRLSTQSTYIIVLKTFFRVLHGTRKYTYPPVVDWLHRPSQRRIKKKIHRPDQLLTEDDVQRLVDQAANVRDRALYMTLWDSGARISELLDLQIGAIQFDEHGAFTYVTGKTGQRRIRFVHASAYLREYLSVHPQRANPNAYLFISSKGRRMNPSQVWHLIQRAAKRAGLTKHVHPHLFRHSRSTINASFMTAAQMNTFAGWVQGSSMPQTYIHLAGKDLDPAILEHYGKVVIPETKREELLKPVQCPRCEQENPATNGVCFQCGSYLSVKTAQEKELEETERFTNLEAENQHLRQVVQHLSQRMDAVDASRAETDDVMNRLVEDPEYMALVRRKLRELS